MTNTHYRLARGGAHHSGRKRPRIMGPSAGAARSGQKARVSAFLALSLVVAFAWKIWRSRGMVFHFEEAQSVYVVSQSISCARESAGYRGKPMEPLFSPMEQEPFVDAQRAASFLAMPRKTLLAKSRSGHLPAHPIGQGPRKIWRFRLSELSRWLDQKTVILDSHRGRNERNIS